MQLLFVCYYVSLDVFASGVWATFAGLRDQSLRELAVPDWSPRSSRPEPQGPLMRIRGLF